MADGTVPGHVLVKIKAGASINAIAAKYQSVVLDKVPGTRLFSLRKPAGTTEAQFVKILGDDSRVVFAETNTYMENPEVKGLQIHFAADAGPDAAGYENQQAYSQVNSIGVGALSTGAGIVVAVLDTGATFDHPALAGRYLPGYNAIQPTMPPLDVSDGPLSGSTGHGTMIAGIILKLAPNARILPVRVLNSFGVGTALDVAKGINFAVKNGAHIINMSFGSAQRSKAVDDALDLAEAKGVAGIASAGNGGAEEVQNPTSRKGVNVVGAVDSLNIKADYSNYGSWVKVVAPGTGIRSTFWTGGYATWSGTSFAAPFVSAQSALMLSVNPTLTPSNLRSAIRSTARSIDDINPLFVGLLGKGVIDVFAAVNSVR